MHRTLVAWIEKNGEPTVATFTQIREDDHMMASSATPTACETKMDISTGSSTDTFQG